MSNLAVINMVLIIGIVWGGFLLCLVTALRREKEKTRHDQ